MFAVDVSTTGAEIVLSLRGELDLWTRSQFVAALALIEGTEARIVFDLADLDFIDAGNIGLIHQAVRLARTRGTQVVLRSPSPLVLRILDLTGLGASVSSPEELDSVVVPMPYISEMTLRPAVVA